MERYKKSIGAFTAEEITALHEKQVCIAGCGGLGGYILEMLARLGILNITIIDGDVFSESNLNRQLLCTEKNINFLKIDAAIQRIKIVNSEVRLNAHSVYLNNENASDLIKDHDVIIDALDNIHSRLLLEKCAEEQNIPLIHGAMQDWLTQIAVVMPGDRTLERLYGAFTPPPPSVPSFTPAFCASLQVSETVKLLCGKETLARGQILVYDLFDNSVNIIRV